MMKLNNKGFAISTMLYGILMMVILILYLILSIMSSGLRIKRQIVDDELQYINKCYNRRVQLEKCYKTYNMGTDPISCADDYDAYTACMGYETNTTYSSATATIKETVIDYSDVYTIINSNSTLILDDSSTSARYVFVGANPNNYIKIGSRTGRIISIESNGVVRVMLTDRAIPNMKIDANSATEPNEVDRWKNSVANNKLYQEYLKLDYTNKMVDYGFNIGNINPGVDKTLKTMYENAQLHKFSSVYGTITMEDYLKASKNAHSHSNNCGAGTGGFKLNNISTSANICNQENWIATLGTNNIWTSTPAGTLDKYYVVGGSTVTNANYNATKDLYLVVCLSPRLTVNTKGSGTAANPYIISIK